MATAPSLLSIDEYLHTSYEPDVHFVDGEIEERNVGEHTHNIIQGFFFLQFSLNEQWGMEAIIEQRLRVSSSRVRVCDIAVIGEDDPFEEVMSGPPVLCIEILSPEDRINRAERVLADYFAIGVPNIWLIDPLRRLAYSFNGTNLLPLDPTKLAIKNTEIVIDLTPAFARLDKKLSRNRL